MPLPKLPVHDLDNLNHRRRSREVINQILDYSFDDSRVRTPAEVAAGVVPVNPAYPPFNFLRYGADPTGVANCEPAWTALNNVIAADNKGAIVTIPPGTYLFTTQMNMVPLDAFRCVVFAYGATFKSSGALSTVQVSGGTTNGGWSIYGLQLDNHGDASVVSGFRVVGTSRTRFIDCHVRPGGNNSDYAGWFFCNSDGTDPNTGSYWGLIERCSFRRLTGSDGTIASYAVLLLGAANACKILGGELGDATECVRISPESAQVYVSNGVSIDGVAFEFYTKAVRVHGATTSDISGLRIINCRFEPSSIPGNSLLYISGITTQPTHPPQLGFNYWTPDQVNYFENPNSIYAVSYDSGSNGAIAPSIDTWAPIKARNRAGNLGILDLQTGLDDAGIIFRDQGGTAVLTVKSQSGGIAELFGSADSLRIMGVRALSGAVVKSNNLRGNSAFVTTSLTRAVSFSVAEPDSSYTVQITPTSDWGAQTKPPWITSKGTGGFTVNVQASTSGGTFDWAILR